MALVNDDEVKKIRTELPKHVIRPFFAGDGLVQAQVHLVGFVDLFTARVFGAAGDGRSSASTGGAIGIDALNALGVGAGMLWHP